MKYATSSSLLPGMGMGVLFCLQAVVPSLPHFHFRLVFFGWTNPPHHPLTSIVFNVSVGFLDREGYKKPMIFHFDCTTTNIQYTTIFVNNFGFLQP
jgi:hypothetical protein